MNSLQIQTSNEARHFLPGSVLSGTVSWELEAPPTAIEIELLWSTRGKGTTDSQIINTLRFETPPAEGERPFSFDLPLSPYSFSGKLISLIWSLRLIAYPTEGSVQFNFTLSPHSDEIDLYGDPSLSSDVGPRRQS